jgi:hypothetical protein
MKALKDTNGGGMFKGNGAKGGIEYGHGVNLLMFQGYAAAFTVAAT